MEKLFRELFIENYNKNKIDFIPRHFLINPLYPECDIDTDGELIESKTEYTNYIQCSYDYEDDNSDIFDIYRNIEDAMDLEDLQNVIDITLSELNEREQAIIRMRYGLYEERTELTLDVIAKSLGISRERVRQYESSAMKKLKHPKVSKELKKYLNDEMEFFINYTTNEKTDYSYKRFNFIADFIVRYFINRNNEEILENNYTQIHMEKNNLILIPNSKIESFKETFAKMILEETYKINNIEIDTNLHYNIIYKALRKHGIFHNYFIPENMKIKISLEFSLVNVIINLRDMGFILETNGSTIKIN